ncbi:hypothetical protein N7462_007995 [Penicillium macrosclerotiorum]|uniref:uncharacterized protein n=1 Tax=Penicillium macrosclerotiorum TaxID=303699 RepID=UPI0025496AF3|nr:uncharacterized protein N7462_007995 [Penicillium macrosclerotiorum]KAJ5679751.1 hypothetical protein N7462_007995 [Penicillium macrosclerotiorum]
MKTFTLPIVLGLVTLATARTDISGCISSQTTNQWHEASMIWYVPDTGEICDFVDCGGGRAPPKTDQPGCPLYTGTATLTSSYLPGYGPSGKMTAATTTVSETSSATKSHSSDSTSVTQDGSSMVTTAPTTSPVVSMTTTTSPVSNSGNSTSAAASSTQTGGAAQTATYNVAGVMAVVAAALGAIAL